MLVAAGYRAVAVDMRGYGGSDRPLDAGVYDSNQQIADVLGLLDALGEQKAIFIGHDFDLSGRSGAGSNPPEPHDKYYQLPFASGNLLDWEDYPMEGTRYLDVLAEPGTPLP